jgi:hypothetical protein
MPVYFPHTLQIYLPSVHLNSKTKLGLLMHTCNPSMQEAEELMSESNVGCIG